MIDPITVILWHFEKEVKQNQFLRYKAIPPDVVRFSYIRGYFVYCLFLLVLFRKAVVFRYASYFPFVRGFTIFPASQ